jgi:hypothetical protein
MTLKFHGNVVPLGKYLNKINHNFIFLRSPWGKKAKGEAIPVTGHGGP